MKRKKKTEKGEYYLFGFPINKENIILFVFVLAIFVAICILVDSIIAVKQGWFECSFLFLCLCLWLFHNQKKQDNKNLYEKVAWIAEKESHGLVGYIEIEQRNQNTPEQFRIDFSNQTEKEHLTQILVAHKEDVIKSFFGGQLAESKNIYALDPLEYYFVSLNCFVGKYCTKAYCNIEYTSSWEYKCKLTEYGRVYYKLRLLTQVYIDNNERVQKVFDYIDKQKKNRIMEVLEKNEVSCMSYRP